MDSPVGVPNETYTPSFWIEICLDTACRDYSHQWNVPLEPLPIQRMLLQAHEWQFNLDLNRTFRAEIARENEISRARVTQVMNLLGLEESAQNLLFHADPVEVGERGVTERALRPLLSGESAERLPVVEELLEQAATGAELRKQRMQRGMKSGRTKVKGLV